MILSRACEYGIQALLFLAAQPPGRFVTVRRIARGTRFSAPFLAKVLGQLAAHGLLSSLKGPRGGVRLARPANEIKVIDVVEAIDGLGIFRKCVIGLPRCSEEAPCPFHSVWGPLREEIRLVFSRGSVRELMTDHKRGGTVKPGGRTRR